MTRLEAIGVLLAFGVTGVLLAWLGLSMIWGRRRVPERIMLPAETLSFGPGMALPVIFVEPRFPVIEQTSPLTGKPRRISLWSRPGEPAFGAAVDESRAKFPPSTVDSPYAHSRPWAHA